MTSRVFIGERLKFVIVEEQGMPKEQERELWLEKEGFKSTTAEFTRIPKNTIEITDENEILVLLLGDENASYYDDQKINIPKGMCAKQVGTYQYQSRELGVKTVPAVTIKQVVYGICSTYSCMRRNI